MLYTIYEVTNLVNGKKYRGAHMCKKLTNRYLGSGNQIKLAVKKYGRKNFLKQVIFMAFDSESMYWAEAQLVDKAWVSRLDTYNISLGGRGAIAYSHPQKGKPITPTHALNISKGLKKRFEDPQARLERSIQSTETNNRPEVKTKIKQALTGLKRSDENKLNCKKAAQERVKDPVYLERQSVSQTARWTETPAKWWNNGVKSMRSVECPGPEWKTGRVSFGSWWTNGHKSVMSIECPGDGWSPGRRLKKST